MELKEQLRKTAAQARDALLQRPEKSRAILERLQGIPAYENARQVMTYVSMGSEVDTRPLLHSRIRHKQTVCVPLTIKGGRQMQPCVIQGMDDLAEGAFGVLEPKVPTPCVLEKGDVVIVPALAFDTAGHRLGYGAGYYDRFLANCPALTIGLCYEQCLLPSVSPQAHDIPVDIIVTEARILLL